MNKQTFLADVDQSWTLFLDRDGVLNKRLVDDYVKTPDEFEILDGVLESIYNFKNIFYKIVIVTNQQGIGKGLMSHESLSEIHDKLIFEVKNSNGNIDQIYYCPDLAGLNSLNRKPGPGMAYQAKEDFPHIDFSKSIMVGDSISDIQFGKNLNMRTVMVGKYTKTKETEAIIDIRVNNLMEFSLLLHSYST